MAERFSRPSCEHENRAIQLVHLVDDVTVEEPE
jgi:hypothetical protein